MFLKKIKKKLQSLSLLVPYLLYKFTVSILFISLLGLKDGGSYEQYRYLVLFVKPQNGPMSTPILESNL